jgi:hypothetical protein
MDLGNAGDDPQNVMQFDEIARLQVPRHRLRSDAGEADLSLRIVRIYEIHVEGDLPMDTHGLNFLDQRGAGAFEHIPKSTRSQTTAGSDPRP